MKNSVRKLMNKAGFDIVRYRSLLETNLKINERLGYELEDEAVECIYIIRHNTMLTKRRLVKLYQQVAYCDWYASTKVCLEYLFDKIVSGSVVVIDDYCTYEGCRSAVDEFIKSKQIQVYLASIDNGCRFFVNI